MPGVSDRREEWDRNVSPVLKSLQEVGMHNLIGLMINLSSGAKNMRRDGRERGAAAAMLGAAWSRSGDNLEWKHLHGNDQFSIILASEAQLALVGTAGMPRGSQN